MIKNLSNFLTIISVSLIFSISAIGQTDTSNLSSKAQKIHQKCKSGNSKTYRGASVLVNKISKGAIEVYVVIGSSGEFDFQPSAMKLSVQPLKKGNNSSEKMELIEVGKPATIETILKREQITDKEILLAPKLTMPIDFEAFAVRVDVKGLFNAEGITSIVTKIEGDNEACIGYGSNLSN